jgi:hypothetical protein
MLIIVGRYLCSSYVNMLRCSLITQAYQTTYTYFRNPSEQVPVDINDDIFLSGVGYHRQEIG